MNVIEKEIARKLRAENGKCKREWLRNLKRTMRINAGLNRAIRQGNPNRIIHWQKLLCSFYNVPLSDWMASQILGPKEIDSQAKQEKAMTMYENSQETS